MLRDRGFVSKRRYFRIIRRVLIVNFHEMDAFYVVFEIHVRKSPIVIFFLNNNFFFFDIEKCYYLAFITNSLYTLSLCYKEINREFV